MKTEVISLMRQISGAAMTLSFMFCYLPQFIKIYKTESSKDVSVLMILLGLSGYINGLIYMYCNQFGIWWFLNYLSGIISSGFLFYYWYKHRK
jgi:uncharacterized protein with PQ loop repeat